MAQTLIHTWVEECRAGLLATRVGRLPSGWVIMGERQVLTGYCLLLPDPVVPDLNALDAEDRTRFLRDMSWVGDALLEVSGAVRINYAIYGNVEPALHAHVFPRSAQEPQATRTAQPWALDWNAAPHYSAATHGGLQDKLREVLQRQAALS
jgi:diadenosine tetraphosphate (Ap4A) HIT family hydrolase